MSSGVFIEFLDDGEASASEVEVQDYFEYDDGRGPAGPPGPTGVIVLEATDPDPVTPIEGVLYVRKVQ